MGALSDARKTSADAAGTAQDPGVVPELPPEPQVAGEPSSVWDSAPMADVRNAIEARARELGVSRHEVVANTTMGEALDPALEDRFHGALAEYHGQASVSDEALAAALDGLKALDAAQRAAPADSGADDPVVPDLPPDSAAGDAFIASLVNTPEQPSAQGGSPDGAPSAAEATAAQPKDTGPSPEPAAAATEAKDETVTVSRAQYEALMRAAAAAATAKKKPQETPQTPETPPAPPQGGGGGGSGGGAAIAALAKLIAAPITVPLAAGSRIWQALSKQFGPRPAIAANADAFAVVKNQFDEACNRAIDKISHIHSGPMNPILSEMVANPLKIDEQFKRMAHDQDGEFHDRAQRLKAALATPDVQQQFAELHDTLDLVRYRSQRLAETGHDMGEPVDELISSRVEELAHKAKGLPSVDAEGNLKSFQETIRELVERVQEFLRGLFSRQAPAA